MRYAISLATLLFLGAGAAVADDAKPTDDEARLLRFPTIHGQQIVFSYAGDLYTVPRPAAWPAGSPAMPATRCFRTSRRTANGSPSPASTTATPRFT